MPTYVYECRKCEKSFEIEQRISEAPLTDCECGGAVRRIIQPVGIAFKGSGFYVNDSAVKPAEKTAEKPSDKESAPVTAETPAAPTAVAPTPAASSPVETKTGE